MEGFCRKGICLTNGQALTEIAQNHTISFGHEEGNPVPKRVFCDDQEITDEIRTAKNRQKRFGGVGGTGGKAGIG